MTPTQHRIFNTRAKPALTLIFTDFDGTQYFTDSRGDIVRKDGSLVTVTEEQNIRAILSI